MLLAAINNLTQSQKGFMDKLVSIEMSVAENLKNIQALTTSVQTAQAKVGELLSRIDPLEVNTLAAMLPCRTVPREAREISVFFFVKVVWPL